MKNVIAKIINAFGGIFGLRGDEMTWTQMIAIVLGWGTGCLLAIGLINLQEKIEDLYYEWKHRNDIIEPIDPSASTITLYGNIDGCIEMKSIFEDLDRIHKQIHEEEVE